MLFIFHSACRALWQSKPDRRRQEFLGFAVEFYRLHSTHSISPYFSSVLFSFDLKYLCCDNVYAICMRKNNNKYFLYHIPSNLWVRSKDSYFVSRTHLILFHYTEWSTRDHIPVSSVFRILISVTASIYLKVIFYCMLLAYHERVKVMN